MGPDAYFDWRTKGKCSTLKPHDYDKKFFPKGGRVSNEQKEYCKDCPVLSLCLADAIKTDADGIWAGTSKADRLAMTRALNKMNTVVVKRIVRRKNVVFH